MHASYGISAALLTIALGFGCAGSTDTTTGGAGGKATSSGTGGATASGGNGGSGGLPEGKCRASTDCKVMTDGCVPPGSKLPCGACFDPPDTCQSDADCAAGGPSSICETAQCACNGEKACTPGCTSAVTCGTGEDCGSDHRCAPRSCAQQLDCPINFRCPPVNNSHCERRSCKVDPECDQGYCVEGLCYDLLGDCTPPVP